VTEVRDLGALAGPVLVFGGPYGNLEACDALLAAAERHGIDGRNAICTGDVVAYGADPQAVVDRLRAWGCAIVMGNCEESLAAMPRMRAAASMKARPARCCRRNGFCLTPRSQP